jgi:hypothetical protein
MGRALAHNKRSPVIWLRSLRPRDADDPNDDAVTVEHRLIGNFSGEFRAVSPPDPEASGPAPALAQLVHDSVRLRLLALRHDQLVNWSAECLVPPPSVQFLGNQVPEHNFSSEIGGDYRLIDRIRDGQIYARGRFPFPRFKPRRAAHFPHQIAIAGHLQASRFISSAGNRERPPHRM